MVLSNPIKDWEKFGATDPYFGVLSSEKNRGAKLDSETLNAFYGSGDDHIRDVLKIARLHFGFAPHGRAFDFGCGVGRLTCAMSEHFAEVVGLDISPGMLAKAKEHAGRTALKNVQFVNALEGYVIQPNSFDFVHSYIVLQHMPIRDGERAICDMVASLKTGGFGALHFPYASNKGGLQHGVRELAKRNIVTRSVGNVLLGRKWDASAMLMSTYSVSRILEILAGQGIEKLFVHRIDDWGSLGLYVFFAKGPNAASEWSNPIS